jgi:transcription elongation factor GreB
MSKAFTREDDSESNEDSIPRRKLGSGADNVITAAGARRFQAEIEQLMLEKQATEGAGTAAASETDLNRMRSRIRQLQDLLQSSTVAEVPSDRESVALGAGVKVRYQTGEVVSYQIVGPEEIDLERDRISGQSPLGRQLIGRKAGERFRFRAPMGEQELEILSVVYD